MPIHALEASRPELPEAGHFWIAPTADIIGRVSIGRDVSIWFRAVARGDNEWLRIGERTNIQDGAVLHADPGFPLTIGADCTIGHGAILHGCSIGANSLIGMGATLLNSAQIGANCLVGANALVTEGKTFPEGSLIVGAPAKAIRSIDAAAIQSITESARGYVERWRRYASGLRSVD